MFPQVHNLSNAPVNPRQRLRKATEGAVCFGDKRHTGAFVSGMMGRSVSIALLSFTFQNIAAASPDCARDSRCFDVSFRCNECCSTGNASGQSCWTEQYTPERCCKLTTFRRRRKCEPNKLYDYQDGGNRPYKVERIPSRPTPTSFVPIPYPSPATSRESARWWDGISFVGGCADTAGERCTSRQWTPTRRLEYGIDEVIAVHARALLHLPLLPLAPSRLPGHSPSRLPHLPRLLSGLSLLPTTPCP